jgi:hypothetical protein
VEETAERFSAITEWNEFLALDLVRVRGAASAAKYRCRTSRRREEGRALMDRTFSGQGETLEGLLDSWVPTTEQRGGTVRPFASRQG